MLFSLSQIVARFFRKNKNGYKKPNYELTEIEQIILEEISLGKSYRSIAEELFISKEEVQKHVRVIYEKLQEKKKNEK